MMDSLEDSMQNHRLRSWEHSHTFGQELKRPREVRTLIVIGIAGVMMMVEIFAGVLYGSMALFADGLHMASHTAALSINAFAYIYARRHARDPRYSFGTGKVNALGGFSGALLLAIFAFMMAMESLDRFIHPVDIVLDQAIFVAVLGLVVNGICFLILGIEHHHHDDDDEQEYQHVNRNDLNLKSAHLHIMADALTSLFAIGALLAAKYLGYVWMDPLMGIVGAILVAQWSLLLLHKSSNVLLDRQGPESISHRIKKKIEEDEDSQVVDLHLWPIGPRIYAAIITIVAHAPATPDQYKARIPKIFGLSHITIEVYKSE
jgi:cation diffusion facilitator family transporter